MSGLVDSTMVGINHRPTLCPQGRTKRQGKKSALGSHRNGNSVCINFSDPFNNLTTKPTGNYSLWTKSYDSGVGWMGLQLGTWSQLSLFHALESHFSASLPLSFLISKTGMILTPTLTSLLWELNEAVHIRYQAHRKCSIHCRHNYHDN